MPTKTKLCRKCGQTKDVELFGADKNSSDGRRYECKQCRSGNEKHVYEVSKGKISARAKKYKDKNRGKVRAAGRKYYHKHKEEALLYRQENAERIRTNARTYRNRIRPRAIAYFRDYYRRNKKQLIAKQGVYVTGRLKVDINFRILSYLRGRVYRALMGYSKAAKTKELLGCSIEELRAHIESKFLKGMTWDNYGQWHMDHIIPCCSFNMSIPEEQRRCFHFTNLQPLWAIDNIRKGGRMLV
jgi:hypothetical protein